MPDAVYADGAALRAYIDLARGVNTDLAGVGDVSVVWTLTTDEMSHKLQVAGQEVDAVLRVVDDEEV